MIDQEDEMKFIVLMMTCLIEVCISYKEWFLLGYDDILYPIASTNQVVVKGLTRSMK